MDTKKEGDTESAVERSLAILDLLLAPPDQKGGKKGSKKKRESDLLVRQDPFADGLADSPLDDAWAFYLPTCFGESLNISRTDRMQDGRKTRVTTQGSRFCFGKGALIYDCREAYQLPWKDALGKIHRVIQIESSIPAGDRDEDGKRSSGEVQFQLFEPDNKTKTLGSARMVRMTQDEFVRFLITGKTA